MNLRRLSSVISLPEPERLRKPIPGDSVAPLKTLSSFSRRQLQLNIQPIRLTPKPGTSTKGTDRSEAVPTVRISKLSHDHAIAGPSRQLIPSTPAPVSDTLDGISELPPSSSTRGKVLNSSSKRKGIVSQTTSRIPRGLRTKTPPSKISREKSMAKRRLSRSTHRSIAALHPRIKAVTELFLPASPLSGTSTDQFEADELAAAAPTPAPSHQQSSISCQSNCLEAFEEIKNSHKELVMSHKLYLERQTAHFERQNKLIEKQTEVLCKLSSLLDKNIEVFNHISKEDNSSDGKENKRARPKRRYSFNNYSDSSKDGLSDTEKEDGKVIKEKKGCIGHQAESQYNEIRSEFGFLKLKTPGKDRNGGSTETPKTPKSMLSRTLQFQLGDIFEES